MHSGKIDLEEIFYSGYKNPKKKNQNPIPDKKI